MKQIEDAEQKFDTKLGCWIVYATEDSARPRSYKSHDLSFKHRRDHYHYYILRLKLMGRKVQLVREG